MPTLIEKAKAYGPNPSKTVGKAIKSPLTTANRPKVVSQSPKSLGRTQGMILVIVGIVLCLLGFLFSAANWPTGSSFMRNLSRAEIVILHGHVLIKKGNMPEDLKFFERDRLLRENPGKYFDDKYETRGRLAIPLQYVLTLGVIFSAVGTIFIITRPQNGNVVGKDREFPADEDGEI